MADDIRKSAIEKVAGELAAHGVEFIVIGGQAELIYGSSRVTYDVDLCYRRTADNLQRLAAALKNLNPSLRGAPADLPFTIDARSLALGNNFTLVTSLGSVDLLGWVEPVGDYEQLQKHCDRVRVGEIDLQIISLEDLIRVKQFIRRPKDEEALRQLLAIQKIRRESGSG